MSTTLNWDAAVKPVPHTRFWMRFMNLGHCSEFLSDHFSSQTIIFTRSKKNLRSKTFVAIDDRSDIPIFERYELEQMSARIRFCISKH